MGKRILIKCHMLPTRESEYDELHIPAAPSSSVLVG